MRPESSRFNVCPLRRENCIYNVEIAFCRDSFHHLLLQFPRENSDFTGNTNGFILFNAERNNKSGKEILQESFIQCPTVGDAHIKPVFTHSFFC